MPEELNHVSADHLADYLHGELDPSLELGVEEHIGSCLVCARRLREEAELEVLLFEAHDGMDAAVAPRRSRRAMWQQVVATVANTAAAAAALLMVITPGQPLIATGTGPSATSGSSAGTASAFVNDALCFPSAAPSPADEECDEPGQRMVAMLTDPDDYLSPFDESTSARGAAICSVEDLACEPS